MHKATEKRAKKLGIKVVEDSGEFVATWKGYTERSKKSAKEVVDRMVKVQIEMKDAEEEAEREFPSLEALQKAKPKYKARGDINNCGDWLALVLKDEFLSEQETDEGQKTEFDVDGFTECLEANGVPVMKGRNYLPFANRRSRGWQGRFRMNGRQKLEVVVAKQGFVKIGRDKIKAPRQALSVLRQKHPQE
jgi:hypothetical protein